MSQCPHCDEAHDEGVDFCPNTGRPIVDIVDRMIGRTIAGKYKLIRSIGQGGMGTIFEAEHTMIGNHVAVKLLHQPFAERREPVQRLYREAKATGAVGHPNIIKVHDVGETADGVPFLVMELLKGESVGERIDREGPQTLGFVFDVGTKLLSALHAAHRAGIIHRDLKSDNIFLLDTEDGEVDIKILDFGISKFTSPDMENLKLTQTGSVLGTPYYMSPEQASGKKDLDERIDIYSAGVILYEILVGTIPHTASNYNALLIEILTEDVKPFRWLRPDVPPALEQTVLKAMARGREQRWSDALDFMEALNSAREGLDEEVLSRAPVVRRDLSIADRDSKTMDIRDVSLEEISDVPMAFETGNKTTWAGFVANPRRRAALIGGALAVLLAVIAGTVWMLKGSGEVKDDDPADVVALSVNPGDAGAAEDTGDGEDVNTVRLSITRVPADAEISVDGITVPEEGMELVRTGITMKLVASASGYETKVLDIVPTVDLDLDITLEKSTEGSAAEGEKTGPKKGGPKKVGPRKGGAKTGGAKTGGAKTGKKGTKNAPLDRPMDNPF